MKIRTNSPTVLDLVIRLLTQSGIALRKTSNNEVSVTNDDLSEGEIRLILQEKLDEAKFDFDDDFVLVNGNSVWSKKRILKEFAAIKKADSTSGITGYFYKFMHLNLTVASDSMRGWMLEYPSFDNVISLCSSANIPDWKSDVRSILEEVNKTISHARR